MPECPSCKSSEPPKHMHSTAYDLPQTHMAGSERFVCPTCDHVYSRQEATDQGLVYVLDK